MALILMDGQNVLFLKKEELNKYQIKEEIKRKLGSHLFVLLAKCDNHLIGKTLKFHNLSSSCDREK